MPEGPNGLPRLTDIGPAVKDAKELEQDEIWIETKRENSVNLKSRFIEYSSFVDDFHSVQGEERGQVVNVQMNYKEWDTVLGDTKFFTYTGGRIKYAVSDIGYIHKIKVDEDLRRLGIGREMISIALDDMKEQKVKKVYTKAISQAGDELTSEFGFTPHDELNKLNPRDRWKVKQI